MASSTEIPTYKGITILSDGATYNLWAHNIRIYLTSKGVYKKAIVQDAPAADATADVKAAWETADAKAHSILCRTMTQQLNALYANKNSAKSLWDALKDRYAKEDVKQQLLAFDDLSRVTLKTGQTLSSYCTECQSLYERCITLGRAITDAELC